MNLMTLNIRGIGETAKAEWVCRLKRNQRLSLIAIQETQLGDLENSLNIARCWGNDNYGFEYVDASGRSGGLLTIWDPSFFSVDESVMSRHFLAIFGSCPTIDGQIAVVNVYGPKLASEKAKLWGDLLNLKQTKHATWIILGDFNEVRGLEERINSSFCKSSSNSFNNFIDQAELYDLKMGGNRFTYFRQWGAKLSKLDRILVCSSFVEKFPTASSVALPKELLDHSPVILKTDSEDFGPPPPPPPFKLFNSWMLREGFDQLVVKSWETYRGFGAADSYLANKLRYLKGELKKWRSSEYHKEHTN
ncbi:uncharacterized protein LOC128128957 [Lactuca sativa]|uniref:uncharacterized protein LOC128128957 n=1 Tax=Lactuca sativa TaxID=4236 RepID=UPI0022AF59F7|nr:uncharacterized protein LOC128128957 [Lactuca sativa]